MTHEARSSGDQAESAGLSERARAILREVELTLEAQRRGVAAPETAATGSHGPSPPPDPQPAPERATDADTPLRTSADASREQLAALVYEVVERTEAARRQLAKLSAVLEQAAGGAAAPVAPTGDRAASGDRPAAAQPPAAGVTTPGAALRGDSGASTEAARLVAIEMAVAGAIRAEVEARLRDEFAIADPAAILDDVFGPDSGGSARMPWGSA